MLGTPDAPGRCLAATAARARGHGTRPSTSPGAAPSARAGAAAGAAHPARRARCCRCPSTGAAAWPGPGSPDARRSGSRPGTPAGCRPCPCRGSTSRCATRSLGLRMTLPGFRAKAAAPRSRSPARPGRQRRSCRSPWRGRVADARNGGRERVGRADRRRRPVGDCRRRDRRRERAGRRRGRVADAWDRRRERAGRATVGAGPGAVGAAPGRVGAERGLRPVLGLSSGARCTAPTAEPARRSASPSPDGS